MGRLLPEPVLFLDECLGSTDVPAALRALGCDVQLLRESFPADTPDPEWLREAGLRGWVVLTKDDRIRRPHVELEALLRAGVAAFVLTGGNLTGAATARAFVLAHARIRKLVRDYVRPFIAAVDASGRVRFLTEAVRRAAKKKS